MNRLFGILLALALTTPALRAQTSNPVINHIWSVGMDSSRVQQLAGSLVAAPPITCRPTSDWTEYATPESFARMDSTRVARRKDWSDRFNVRGTGKGLALGGGELALALEEAGAAGIIGSRPKDALGTREIFETYTTRAPNVSLSCEDYGLVFRLTERGNNPKLRLDLESEALGE